LAEPELLLSIACHADVLSLISHRERAILGDRLEQSQEDQGPGRE